MGFREYNMGSCNRDQYHKETIALHRLNGLECEITCINLHIPLEVLVNLKPFDLQIKK